MEADDEDDSGRPVLEGDQSTIDPKELEILREVLTHSHKSTPLPKSSDKRDSSQLDSSHSSETSGKDLDAKGVKGNKKTLMPMKAAPNPRQWAVDDIDFVREYWYKTDVDHFQKYRTNIIDLGNHDTINVKDHSAYITIAKATPRMVIEKSVFSVATYWEVLQQKGLDLAKFDRAIGAKFPLLTKASQEPDDMKVLIDHVMLVCQCPNGADVAYADSNGFGCPGMLGLWDLHSNNVINWVKLPMKSKVIDTNFCAFWSTNNETLNNHIRNHYRMGLTCQADGFMMASVSTLKQHMEQAHRYEGKHAGQKKKGKI